MVSNVLSNPSAMFHVSNYGTAIPALSGNTLAVFSRTGFIGKLPG